MSVKQVSTFCRVCEPSCALVAEVEGDEIISLKPDRNHPVTKGFACHKGIATLDIHKDPDRLMYPQMRVNGELKRVSWDEVSAEIAARLKQLKDQYGPGALGSYTGNPLAFNALAGPAIGSFVVKNGIRKNFSSGTQDCANKFAAGEAIFGSSTIHPIPDIEHTDFLLMFGANPRVSHMSFISIADPVGVLRDAKKRGADIRFVDPRVNESVKGLGEVVHVKPDTDVYLMAAMLNHLQASGQFDEEALAEHGENLDGLKSFITKYPPQRVAEVVGVSAEEITKLADDFAAAERAAIYMSTGVNMGRQGTLAYWLMFMLSLATGNFDRRGGNYYSLGFYPAAKAGRVQGDFNPFQTGPFGEVRKIRGSLPGNLLADMILAEEDPIKGMVVISGNPLRSIGNSAQLEKAFAQLELLIVIDIYPNATAEYADFVLPAADMYEREDINMCGLGMQHRPFVQYTNFIVPPKAERKPEWWILGKLEQAQGVESILDDGETPYLFGRTDHMLKHCEVSVPELAELPSHTKVLPENVPGRFFSDWIQTESGKIDCCPSIFSEALDTCEAIFNEYSEGQNQLKMISRRTNYMVNSWFHNVKKLKRGEHLNNPLYMHPEDARARNLGDGSEVRIYNDNGSITSVVSLDEDLKLGTVAMTHGWGHSKTGMNVAKAHPGTNANELLPSGPGSYEKLSNQAFMTGIPVDVESI